jgi:hypothetical protein
MAAGTHLLVEETADGVLLKAAPVFEPKRSESSGSILERISQWIDYAISDSYAHDRIIRIDNSTDPIGVW